MTPRQPWRRASTLWSSNGRLPVAQPRLWPDIGTAAAFLVFLGVPTLVAGSPSASGLDPQLFNAQGTDSVAAAFIVAAAVGMPLALVWRACRPVTSTAIIYSLALTHFAMVPSLLPIDLAIFLALYSVTVHGPRWAERVALIGGLIGALLAVLAGRGNVSRLTDLVALLFACGVGAALVVLAWGAGLLRRSQAERRDTLRERAERLERERNQQAWLAAAAERTRIAREMHDVIAHSLSIIIAQADGGRYAASSDPAAAGLALETIAETGRAALSDTRRILGILRDDETSHALAPAPSSEELDSLFAHIRRAGVPVSQVEMGKPVGLPPGTSAALYRIVQESLTNVLKHGGPDVLATVMIEWKPGTIRVVVSDNGRGAASLSDGRGNGLIGMRERAAMLGGALTAGPGPSGGFRVEASLPTGPSDVTS